MGFAEYEVQAELMRAGMSVTYRAWQRGTGRTVLLEVIAPTGAWERPAFVWQHARGKYEAVALLSHPNLLPILEMGETENGFYLIHPGLETETVEQVVGRQRVPPGDAARWVAELAGAVQHAHEHGVFHCDVKPGNVLLSDEGTPLLTGFDCALVRFLHPPPPELPEGSILGTPAFMSPEQATGRRLDFSPAMDVWGLGALLYTLLTSQPPFRGASAFETIRAVVAGEAPSARSAAGVDRDVDAICRKCMQKKPEDRYPTAAALAEDLGRYLDGEPISLMRPTPPRRPGGWMRRWWNRQP